MPRRATEGTQLSLFDTPRRRLPSTMDLYNSFGGVSNRNQMAIRAAVNRAYRGELGAFEQGAGALRGMSKRDLYNIQRRKSLGGRGG